MIFKNRFHAGTHLAPLLSRHKDRNDVIILGLARGGVVTAAAIAQFLHLPFDVLCPRKIGAPFNPELAIGAISDEGEPYLNEGLILNLEVSEKYIKETIQKERLTARKRLQAYRKGRSLLIIEGKTVILVDDGLATGATMHAAVKGVKELGPASIVIAVPVSPPNTLEELKKEVDEVICLISPDYFAAVGQFYEDFSQTGDSEVLRYLQSSRE